MPRFGQGNHRGRDSFEQFFRGWIESFDGFRVEPEEVVERGDRLIAVVRQSGRGRASGVEVEARLAHVWTVAAGKAVRWEAVPTRTRRSRMADQREDLARDALERVCSGSDPSAAVGVYSPAFRDHVNGRDYLGHEGIQQSLALYQLVFRDGDLQIRVEDQVSDGDKVVSRWVAEGHNRGRPWGIVISRIEDGEIAEDWAASDSLEVVRRLGLWRTLLLGIDWLRGGGR